MNRIKNKRGSILPLTIFLLAIMLMGMQTVLTITAQHNWRMNDLLAQEQSRYLAASGWNIAIEELQKADTLLEQKRSLSIEEVGSIDTRWVCLGEKALVTAVGRVGQTSCTYQGVLRREAIYPEQSADEKEEASEIVELKPIGYELILQERRID